MMQPARWLAVDWGTTRLRIWPEGRAHDMRTSEQGMNSLSPGDFSTALRSLASDLIDPAQKCRVIICGMAGARQGWREAPYLCVPCRPPRANEALRFSDDNLDIVILPGVKQMQPADVMRGEETQIAGFVATRPDWDGVLCLPGTHTKWVHLSAGEIVSFQTFMTGEIFALLSTHSVLRHDLTPAPLEGEFTQALERAMSRPAAIASEIFRLRAAGLLHGLSGADAYARLSGLLIGAELAAARPYWLGQNVALIADGAMAAGYMTALTHQGLNPELVSADFAVRRGLQAAHAQWEDIP